MRLSNAHPRTATSELGPACGLDRGLSPGGPEPVPERRPATGAASASALWIALLALAVTVTGPGRPATAQVTPLGAEIQVNTYTAGSQSRPDVEWRANGEIVVVWESSGSLGDDNLGTSVQMRRLSSNGTPIGTELQVNTFTTGLQSTPRVGSADDGSFVVVFAGQSSDSDPYSDILARRFAANGTALGNAFLVNSYTTQAQTAPAVAQRPNAGFTVVWTNPGGYGPGNDSDAESVAMRRVSSSGTPQGSDLQVNTYTTDKQFLPAAAMDSGGDFIVVWQSNGSNDSDTSQGSVRARRYSSAGTPVGASFQLNTYTTGTQGQAAVAAAGDGSFVVVWPSNGSTGGDSSLTSIQRRRFDASGTGLGSEMQVNQYTTGFQSVPDVAERDDGTFLVVWQSSNDNVDTSGWSVHGRLYSPTGTALGSAFLLASYTTGNQERPHVAFSPDGGHFVAVWDSVGSSGSDSDSHSTQLRRFEVDSDGDGVDDGQDVCPGFDDSGPDADADGVPNACDVCPGGDDTRDGDGDGVPDACDLCTGDDATGDNDGDGVCAEYDCDDNNGAVTCFIFADGFEYGDATNWTAISP